MKRAYESLLKEYLSYFPCVAIIGARQCGKTTLIKTLPSSWKKYDLEKSSDFDIISRDTDLFFKLNSTHIAIDEAQIQPKLFSSLRVAIDENRAQKGRFVITGSSSPELSSSIFESLAGRIGIIHMSPLSCSEAFEENKTPLVSWILRKESIKNLLKTNKPKRTHRQIHEYWWRGGYPEPWIENNPKFTEAWMSQYIQTYLQRDIAKLFPSLNHDRFRLFLQLLAGLSGTVINYSDVARSLSVSAPVIRDYFGIADKSFIWRQIPAFEKKTLKRIVKHPRGYLRDSGLLHHMLKIPDLNSLLAHPRMGASWESMVIEEILRGFEAKGESIEYSYYRTGAGAEVDLVIEGKFGLVPIEVKYSQTVPSRQLKSLSDFIKENKCPYGIVINNDDEIRQYDEKILGIPFSYV